MTAALLTAQKEHPTINPEEIARSATDKTPNTLRQLTVRELNILSCALTQLIQNTDTDETPVDDEQALLDAVDFALVRRLSENPS